MRFYFFFRYLIDLVFVGFCFFILLVRSYEICFMCFVYCIFYYNNFNKKIIFMIIFFICFVVFINIVVIFVIFLIYWNILVYVFELVFFISKWLVCGCMFVKE